MDLPEGAHIAGFQERLNSYGASSMNLSTTDLRTLFHKEEENEKN
jgi:hypothetical protein